MNTTIERPKAGETDDDLLRLQAEFLAKKEKDLPRRPKQFNTCQKSQSRPTKSQPERFVLDLENLPEEPPSLLFDIQETNADFLNDRRFNFHLSSVPTEDGFPEVSDGGEKLDCWTDDGDGRSVFEREMDKRGASMMTEDGTSMKTEGGTSHSGVDESKTDGENGDEGAEMDFSAENDAKLKAMSAEQIERERCELIAKLDPKLIEFLQHRGQKKVEVDTSSDSKQQKTKAKESRFKALKQGAPEPVADEKRKIAEEAAKNLEVIDDVMDYGDGPASRLAADPVQLDLTFKCMQSMLPRREQAVLRMFDSFLPQETELTEGNSDLLTNAKRHMIDIKNLFLESGWPQSIRFSAGISPMTDGTWMFHPIRRTLDQIFALQKSGQTVQSEHIEAVRLTLLWSLLLFKERPTLFHACASPADVYCRLAEVFLLGPDVFLEETIHQCLAVFLDDYIIVQAQQGRLQFPLEVPIAGLDALLPFYEDLVRRFEEWSYGDLLYSKTLLIPCYLNINLASATFLRMTLWSQENSSIVRQILLREHDLKLARSAPEEMKFQEEQNYENYSKLLVLYAAAIMNETVVRERNPLMFKIAAEAVGQFVDRHKNAPVSDFTQMASMLVKAVRSKIPI